jgi:SAM-dependent methyltransferase
MQPYTQAFYHTYEDESRHSAEQAVPILQELIAPRTVVDVGCGIGTWLSVFRQLGVSQAVGIDGDYIEREHLMIPGDAFVAHDLTKPLRLPPHLPQEFDLAVSLEVGEHLPERSASHFVGMLTSLAPVVAFSAAVPFQGGTHHINEQWPNYWAGLFGEHGYSTVDCLRPRLWNDPKIAYYYAQNMILYVRNDHLSRFPKLAGQVVQHDDRSLARIHPAKWLEANNPRRQLLRKILPAVPYAVKNAITSRFHGRS